MYGNSIHLLFSLLIFLIMTLARKEINYSKKNLNRSFYYNVLKRKKKTEENEE